ncbi:MAG: DUF1573 domain-containing protein [Acidimicrobiia bacterium]|nr:DUF1573 domain-containing protein [Acidimicrobiia bacterium]
MTRGFRIAGLLTATLLACVAPVLPEVPGKAAETIKERVTQYFAAVQSDDIAKAKEFVLQKARASFFPQSDSKLINLRVAEVHLESGGVSAVVKLFCQVMIPMAMQPVDVPQVQRWKLESGIWYFDPSDPPPSDASIMKKYYYEKLKSRKAKDPSQWNVRFDKEVQNFGIAVKGSTVTLRFPFVNQTARELRLEKVILHQLMRDLTSSRVISAGKRGEVVIALDTAPLYRDFDQDIFVQFEPIQEMVKLKIHGRVFTAKDLEMFNPAGNGTGKGK